MHNLSRCDSNIQFNKNNNTQCSTDSEQDWSGTCTAAEDTAAGQTDAVEQLVSPAVSAAAEPSPALENSDQSGLLQSRGTAAGRPSPRQSVHVTTGFFHINIYCKFMQLS